MHGARAVLMVNDTAAHPGDGDHLEKFGATAGPANSGIEFIQVRADSVAPWFTIAGKSMPQLQADIDRTLKPNPISTPVSSNVGTVR